MKLVFTLIIVSCLSVSAKTALSQDVKMSVDLKGVAISKLINIIEKQSPYKFIYNNNIFPANSKVDVSASNQSVAEILDKVLQNSGFTYKLLGDNIIVVTKATEAVQSKRITGMVVDENDNPLPGVTIRFQNEKRISTATDVNGHFGIESPNENDILIISFIGYQLQQFPVKNITAGLRVTMKSAVGSLDEVQVIGYGTTTRALNTGSVSSITAKDIGSQPVSNPLAAMQGRLPGVQITQNNGLPGAGYRVQIRGVGSIGSGTLPLYIIDGVPFTLFNGSTPATDGLNAYGVSGANGGETSPLGMINPDDIERIDVLKDADATAIYGSKGSNGVVLITTKKATGGKTKYTINFYQGVGKVAHFIDELSTPDYLALRRTAFAASGVIPTSINAPDLLVWDQNANTNWQKQFIGGTANTTNVDFSISGGSPQNTFLFTSNYRHEGTVYPGNFGANTFSNRLNTGHKSENNRFGIDLNVNYGYMQNNLPSTDLSTLYNLAPNMPLYNADGTLNWYSSTSTNPLVYILRPNNNTTTNLLSKMDVYYQVAKGLTVKANLGYTLTGLKQTLATPLTSLNPASVNLAAPSNTLRYANNTYSNYIVEPQAEYRRKVLKGDLNVLIGGTFQETVLDGINLQGTGFSSDALINSINNAASIINFGSNNSDYKYNALFGRVNYIWEDKYLLNGTFRRDGSSRFGPSHRFGNFWAVGAAWVFTQEALMKNISWLSFGKLRASYGLTGNDQIANYQYYPYYNAVGSASSYQGQSVIYPSNVPNPDLHWETNKKLDAAIELGFLKDRIYLKADYFLNRSSDQLLSLIVPTQAGISSYTANFPAVVKNQGFEFELSTTNIQSKSFKWATNVNLTIQRNSITSIENPSQLFNTYIIGQPVNGILLYHFTGINPVTGVPTYQDLNGDGSITFAADRIPAPLGNPYYGGITNSFTYKGLTLDVSFLFNHRMGYINNSSSYPYGTGLTNQNTSALERWMAPGDNALYPGATTVSAASYSNYNSSDANWGDASFIKLKTVNLNYMLPKIWVQRVGFNNVSVFARGENLYTWAKQKYTYDPETAVSGAAPGLGTGQFIALPQLRTMVLGFNCTF
ncbi:MAG: SusC/RagA family TonB-linked outer membrane protein [Mucilaginibacter sp.]|uniref:SusC/RagA family TonB-linked outer membrane protein n=1 Tax=Mucilaginibacter sp. TaxID=1882438 RepID=UPI0032642802